MMIGSIKRYMKKVASEGRCQAVRWLTGKDGMSMVGNGGRESEFLVSKVYGVNEIL
jgi:hypothetical protein